MHKHDIAITARQKTVNFIVALAFSSRGRHLQSLHYSPRSERSLSLSMIRSEVTLTQSHLFLILTRAGCKVRAHLA